MFDGGVFPYAPPPAHAGAVLRMARILMPWPTAALIAESLGKVNTFWLGSMSDQRSVMRIHPRCEASWRLGLPPVFTPRIKGCWAQMLSVGGWLGAWT